MAIFSAVVEAESFSEAARRLGIAKSAVSKHISLLEDNIGVRLLNRTTRKLSLTGAGERYYVSCARIVSEAKEANLDVRQLQVHPSGSLRLSCTIAFGTRHIVPVLHKFHLRHPGLKIELLLDDHVVNIVDEAIDLAIRVGWPAESSLVARKLFDFPLPERYNIQKAVLFHAQKKLTAVKIVYHLNQTVFFTDGHFRFI